LTEINYHIKEELKKLSDHINPTIKDVSIILAAGHGKRIKSEKSKMLHEIWGKPSVCRVSNAALKGLSSENQIIIVGKKALEVAKALGKRKNRVFIFQEEQMGTGDAVKKALQYEGLSNYDGDIYVFPGDMGLLTKETVRNFKKHFKNQNCSMLVMTGYFEGDLEDNYYGRIVKSKENDGEVIEIKEHKDILAMDSNQKYNVRFKNKDEYFLKEELLNIREFNAGVYAFKINHLKELIDKITQDNVQNEIYITDLIKIFNDNGLKVYSSPVSNNDFVVAFNIKSVLKKMEEKFRDMMYKKLKDIISIDDPEDFFIAEENINNIIEIDNSFPSLDIKIGKGAYIGRNIKLNRGLSIEKNAMLKGNVKIGKNVTIGENVIFSTYPDQIIDIGDNVDIFRNNIIKGNVKIGNNSRIESGVRITGSNQEPVIIGNDVLIKGISYIFGSIIEDSIIIEHSILKSKYIERVVKKNGEIQPIKYIIPMPEGLDSISSIKQYHEEE